MSDSTPSWLHDSVVILHKLWKSTSIAVAYALRSSSFNNLSWNYLGRAGKWGNVETQSHHPIGKILTAFGFRNHKSQDHPGWDWIATRWTNTSMGWQQWSPTNDDGRETHQEDQTHWHQVLCSSALGWNGPTGLHGGVNTSWPLWLYDLTDRHDPVLWAFWHPHG